MDGRTRHGGSALARGQLIIEGARQNARGRRLSDAANTRQNIGLMNSIEVEGVRQRSDHGLLADQIVETGRAIFAGEDAIGSGGLGPGILRRARRRRRGHRFAGAAGLALKVGLASRVGSAGALGAVKPIDVHRQDLLTRQTRPRARPNREIAHRRRARARLYAKVGGWTETRPVSLGLLPSGPDPVSEWCVHRQPPNSYLDRQRDFRNLFGWRASFDRLQKHVPLSPGTSDLAQSTEGPKFARVWIPP